MSDEKGLEGFPRGRLVLPALVMSQLTIGPPQVLTALLLVDIAGTFGTSVGVVGQMKTFSSLASLVLALSMSVLSIRFKHKSLLLTGLGLMAISALGCGVAMDFNSLLVFYSLGGLGIAMIGPMVNTLIADYFPVQKRAHAMSLTISGMSAIYAIGAPIVSFFAGFGGWRFAFVAFVFVVSLIALLVAFSGLPSARNPQSKVSREAYLGGFKSIFSNRSAVACLLGPGLSVVAWQAILLYSSSFLRQRFLLPTSVVSINSMGAAASYTVGALTSGRFVNRFGRKPLTVFASLLAGLLIMSYMNMPNLWLAIIICQAGCFFAGLRYTAATTLAVEQVPAFRGTMMSLYTASDSMGAALGAGVGGLVLMLYDYGVLGLSIGAMGILGSALLYFLAIDPTKTSPS